LAAGFAAFFARGFAVFAALVRASSSLLAGSWIRRLLVEQWLVLRFRS